MSTRKKRRRLLINRALQFRFVRLAVLPMLLASAGLYYLIYFMVVREMAIPELIGYHLIPALRKANALLAILYPPVALVLIYQAIRISHRIAGPLYRLERELDRAASGETSVRVHFRKRDALNSLASSVNRILERLDERTRPSP